MERLLCDAGGKLEGTDEWSPGVSILQGTHPAWPGVAQDSRPAVIPG